MPWEDVSPMEQKQQFVSLYGSGRFTKTELCLEYGISRKTGDKREKWREMGSGKSS